MSISVSTGKELEECERYQYECFEFSNLMVNESPCNTGVRHIINHYITKRKLR